jgi:hypothetical protein
VPTIANAGHFYQIGSERVKNFSGKTRDFSGKQSGYFASGIPSPESVADYHLTG